ncbi:hypothetical protein HON36_06210 [Candidatus Parcubacteria bacterium]|jgi:hypothetical protein|nr:hypothetical protein [Candidatus Parcubacteria bacterium]MBT7228056.1 hypothetical protein [Candidatus Parcubacteria bacterium]
MNSEKKRTNLLLLILGATLIGSAFYYFFYLRSPEVETSILDFNTIEEAELKKVFEAKEVAIENIFDFLEVRNFEYSIFDNLHERQQYKELEGVEITIDIENNIGNPAPFDVIPYGPDEEDENSI